MDPCELRLARGDEAVKALVAGRKPLFEFVIRNALKNVDLSTAEGRVNGLRAAAPVVAGIRDRALRSEYTRSLAGWLGMREAEVAGAVRAAGRRGIGPNGERAGVPGAAEAASASEARRRAIEADPLLRLQRQTLEVALQLPQLAAQAGVDNWTRELFDPGPVTVLCLTPSWLPAATLNTPKLPAKLAPLTRAYLRLNASAKPCNSGARRYASSPPQIIDSLLTELGGWPPCRFLLKTTTSLGRSTMVPGCCARQGRCLLTAVWPICAHASAVWPWTILNIAKCLRRSWSWKRSVASFSTMTVRVIGVYRPFYRPFCAADAWPARGTCALGGQCKACLQGGRFRAASSGP